MRITAKLAYNQIKINRQRTVWTLLGIILSTALITAVCSFVASGNELLVSIYGNNYWGNGGGRITLLLIPASILTVIIVSMAIVVISNAFRVSAAQRKAQFGVLKSVGTTKRQIISVVMYESIFLSGIGIPVGIIVGLVITLGGIELANHLFAEINSLVNIMMHELIIVLKFVISWQALLTAFIVSFSMVLLSAWIPARKAARVTAIDSIRKVDEVKVEAIQLRTCYIVQKTFGFEGTLALKNIKRSKGNLRASIISLTVGIVLFVCLGFLGTQMGRITEYMYSYGDEDVMVDYTSSYITVTNATTGQLQDIVVKPIDSQLAEKITEKLREYKDADILGMGCDMQTYKANVPSEMITEQMKKAVYPDDKDSTYEMETDIITVDDENYAKLCQQVQVPVGSVLLINHYLYNDHGKAVILEPFVFKKQSFTLTKADGSKEEISVQGQLAPNQVPEAFLGPNVGMLRLIVPEAMGRYYNWRVHTDDIDGFMNFANKVMGEWFPEEKNGGYMEQGFTTRVFEMKDFINVMNMAVNLGMVFVQSFAVLLTLIGLTNVISTMSTNVQVRTHEFAVLQSIGMTMKGVKRMIILESVICSLKSISIGVPLAIVLTCFINIPIQNMLPIPYQFPVATVLGCTVAVFGVTIGTMWFSAGRLQKNSIVESIRLDG